MATQIPITLGLPSGIHSAPVRRSVWYRLATAAPWRTTSAYTAEELAEAGCIVHLQEGPK